MRGGLVAAAAALCAALALPATGGADVISGSPLTGEPTIEKANTVDSVYWLANEAGGGSAAMTVAGVVHAVTIKGYAKSKEPLLRKIFIQVLRPQPGGGLLVVETSQPFELPTAPGTYTFEPTNMTVQPGDFIGIATLGGEFMFATPSTGAVTNDFSGHEKDMNGDTVTPTKVETNVELLAKVDVVSQAEIEQQEREIKYKKEREEKQKKEEQEKVKAKPCKCNKIKVTIDKTLLGKRRVPSNKQTFGVGFKWRMECTEGKGGCTATLRFRPPVVLVGKHKGEKPLKLKLKSLTFVCKTLCKTSTEGRFEIKMRSREQLNKLFGKTLAFTIETSCSGVSWRYLINVFVDGSGHLHQRRAQTLQL